MSDLLNSASLVMIPSGYAEDKVYSVVPSDGSGDLSFTRASNGTRVNSSGLVEVCPWNLVQYSEQFDNAAWGKNNVTVTSNATTAPNGTTTADKIAATANVGFVDSSNFALSVNVYTITMYAKKSNVDWVSIEISDGIANNTKSWYNINTGVLGTTGGTMTIVSRSIESVGNGWYRLILTSDVTPATNPYRFIPFFVATDGALSLSGNEGFAWGAQVNIGSTAKPYFPTTDRLNVPRLTYQNGGGGCPSLLLEKQSTNYAQWSEDFSNSVWNKAGVLISSNVVNSPDGTQNASLIYPVSSGNYKYNFQIFSLSSNVYTFSIFAKAQNKNIIWLYIEDSSTFGIIYFDLNDGTMSTTAGAASTPTGTMSNMGNGWYRCTFTLGSSTSLSAGSGVGVCDAKGSPYATASSTNGVYIWGAQME